MSTSTKTAGSSAQSAFGGVAWINTANYTGAPDSTGTTAAVGNNATLSDVFLTKNGTASVGTGKYDGGGGPTWSAVAWGPLSVGSSSDLWGTTWTYSEINASTFGVKAAARSSSLSDFIIATNFGFSISAGATILGITVDIDGLRDTTTAYYDSATITVTYSQNLTSTTLETMSLTETVTYSVSRTVSVLETATLTETKSVVRSAISSILEVIGLTELLSTIKDGGWTRQTKNTATLTNQEKH